MAQKECLKLPADSGENKLLHTISSSHECSRLDEQPLHRLLCVTAGLANRFSSSWVIKLLFDFWVCVFGDTCIALIDPVPFTVANV